MEFKKKRMNRVFCSALLIFIVAASLSCNSESAYYDKESWNNAFNKQEHLNTNREKVAVLNDMCDIPNLKYIDDHYLYIYDSKDLVVYIYSRENYRIKAKFGGKGEGPGEFQRIHAFKVYDDFIFVNSTGKSSYFSKDGVLLKEEKCPPHLIPCLPVKDNFVTDEFALPPSGGYKTPYAEKKVHLVGSDFKIKNTLFQKTLNCMMVYNQKSGRTEFTLFPDWCDYKVYKNKIYMGYTSLEGFFFTVFNSRGNKLYEITRPYLKRQIPDIFKEAVLKKPYRLSWNDQILKLKFYKYFPSFANFFVADDRIYIYLFPEVDRQRILIMDLKGKLIDVCLVPFDLNVFDNYSYQIFYADKVIHKGQSYYLHDNEEEKQWELWRIKVTNLPLPGDTAADR